MNLAIGMFSSILLLFLDKRRQSCALLILISLGITILSLQLTLVSGLFSSVDQRGFFNILLAAPCFLLAKQIKIKKSIAVLLLISPIIFPITFDLSSYYWKYMVGSTAVLAGFFYNHSPTKFRQIIFFGSLAVLAATIEKYSLIYFLISIYVSGIVKRKPFSLIIAFGVFFSMFYLAVVNSEFNSLSEFLDRRVTRESYASAQGDTVFGVSDGFRFEIWRQQIAATTDSIWFGRGMNWQMFDSDVPNHNLLVTYLITFGIIGSLFIFSLFLLSILVVKNRVFSFSMLALFCLSLVGEGALLPLIAIAVGLQAGIFSGSFIDRNSLKN